MKNTITAFMPFCLLLSAFLSGCDSFQTLAKHYEDARTKTKVGILAGLDITWRTSTGPFAKALKFFREQEVDRVVILGDPTMDGYKNQLEVFETAWSAAFHGITPPELIVASESTYRLGGVDFISADRFALTDLICVEPRTGKTIAAGSMHGLSLSRVVLPNGTKSLPPQWAKSAQGLLVQVFDDGLKVRRLDFSGAAVEEIDPPWRVRADGFIEAEGNSPPEFWPDTRLSVVRGYDKVGNYLYTLRWPTVLAKHTGERAYLYEVYAEGQMIRRVQSLNFHQSENREPASISCIISEAELKGAQPIFKVKPVSSLGLAGRPIGMNGVD